MRFVHERPDRWVWLHAEDPPAGSITDGETHTIIEDGVAVLVTMEGYVGPTHRIGNLLNPREIRFVTSLGKVTPGIAVEREAWLTTLEPRARASRLWSWPLIGSVGSCSISRPQRCTGASRALF
jgi:hypothetical protein